MATAVAAIALAATGASTGTAIAVTAAAAVADLALSSAYSKKQQQDAQNKSAKAPRDVTIRSAVSPANIVYGQARVSGPIVYANTRSTPQTNDNHTLWMAIALANHACDSIVSVWIDGDEVLASQIDASGNVTSGKFGPISGNPVTNFYFRLGSDGVPTFANANVTAQGAITELVNSFSDLNATDHRGRGMTYMASAFELGTRTGEGVWKDGAPRNVRAVVKGKKVYDPRKDSTNGGSGTHRLTDATTWEWSDNPALCLADYLIDDRLGMGVEGISYDDIDWSMVATAATACDATVSTPAGNQKRFTCNGVLTTDTTYSENIKAILGSMMGSITWSGGKYRIRAGVDEAASFTFTEDDIVGDIQVQPELGRTQRFNKVRGRFIDPAQDYAETEFLPVSNATYKTTRDNGLELTSDITLPLVNNEYQAQRIAYKAINLNAQQMSAIIPVNWKGLKVAVGDRINVVVDELGWTSPGKKVIVDEWSFDPDQGFVLKVRETSSDAFADPASGDYSTRSYGGEISFAAQPVSPPSDLSATEEEEAVVLSWSAPLRPSSYDEIIVYRSATSNWSGAAEIGRTRGTTFRHETTYADGTHYYWIRSVDVDGEESIRNPNNDTTTVSGRAGRITTTQLDDDANFALTADWPSITDSNGTRPEDNATYNTGALADKDTVGEADIDNGAVTIDKFGTGLEPVQVVSSLPGTATAGQMAFLTTDNKLYRYNGTAWTAAVPFVDVTGAGDLAELDTITLSYVTDAGDVAALDSISETYIDDDSITTVKINAQAVTAAKIQANTITAAQIAANTITANEIAANTITANQIAANTITSNEIAANTITAGEIAAGTITATEIGAGAIVTSKLAVTGRGSALNSDPNCQDSSAWEKFSGSNATFTTITDGEVGNNVMRSAAGTTWYNGSEGLALDPAKTYRMTALVRKNASANGTFYIGVAAFTQDGTNIQGDGTQWSYGAAGGGSGSTSWTRYTMEFGAGTSYTFPATAVTFKPIVLMNYGGSAGYYEAQDVRIEEKVGADLIVDGSISTNHLSADSITGGVFDASSYLKAGSGDNSAVMSGRSVDEYAFWAGKGFKTDGGPSGADAPFRVTRDGKVIMTNFALYSEAGTKLFDSQDGLLALPQTAVAQASGSLVPQVSEELTSGTDTFTVTLSSTQTITANFAYPVGALFYSGTSLTDAQNNVSSAFGVTLQYSSDSGSTWNTFGSTQNFSKVTSGTPTSSQYLVIANSFTVSIIYGAAPTTVYVASLQSNRGAIDEGMTLVGSTSQSLAAGTYLVRMVFSATGGSGTGAPATDKTREIRLTTSGAGFTVSDGTVSDGVGTSATTGWVLQNFVEKTESDNVTINGTLTLGGNLVVNGTTTTINSTTLEIDDKNIVLASGAADGAAANGAGITIDGANATLTYDNADGNWLFNKTLHMVGTQRITNNGFAGIEYHNADGTWEGYIGTENNTGNLRYNSRLGTHKWYSNSTEIAALTSSALDVPALQIDGTTAIDSSRGASLTGATITGITNTQRDIRSAGQIRATGWYGDAASTDYTGLAAEIGVSSGVAHVISYNRSTSAYGAMHFASTSFTFGNSVTVSGNVNATQLLVGGTTVVNSSRNLVGINAANVGDLNVDNAFRVYVSASDRAHQRADARDDATNYSRLHWYGVNDNGGTSNFRHAWFDGNAYVNVTATGVNLRFDSGSTARHLQIGGGAVTTSNPSGILLEGLNSSSQTFNLEIMNRGNHSSASFTDKIDFSINNNGTYYYSVLRFGKYGDLETKQVIANAAAPYAATDRYFKLTNDAAGKSGTLVTANNGNTWLNADGGKELWLNWYSLSNPTSNANLQVGDGEGGAAILTVIGGTRRVGVNNASPSYPLDVSGHMRTTGNLYANTSGGLLHLGDSNSGDSAGAAQIYYYAASKTLRFYGNHGGTVGVTAYERYNGSGYETVWDSGNDGAGSGLDADLLDGQQGTHYRQSFATLDAGTRSNYDLVFKPASANYAGLRFLTQAGANAGYLLGRADTATDIYDANGITLVTDAGALTLANRTGTSGIRFMTGSTATTKLELTASGVLQHTIPGNLLDGTLYSGYTMNITGASTFGGMRFDRNGTAKFRVGLRSDDMFQIANFNLSSGADEQFLISANGHVLIGTTEDRGLQNRSLRVNGKIDTGDVSDGAFRVYNFATFRGGFGTAAWAGSGAATSMGLYASEHLYVSTGGQSAAKFMFNASGVLEINKSSGTIISHDAMSDAIGYNPSYGTYVGAGSRYIYSGGAGTTNGGTHPYFNNSSNVYNITHDGGKIANTYAGDHTFDSGNTSAGGIVIQGSSTGGPRLGIKSTATGGKEWWLISNNSGNTDGAGYLQFWNHTNGVTAATWSYAAGTRSNIYTPLKVEAKATAPIFTSTTSGDFRPTLTVDTSSQAAHGILVNQTRSDYWAQAISTQRYGLLVDSHVADSGTSLLRCEIGGSTVFNVRGDGNVYVKEQLDVGINSYGHLHLRAYGTLGGYLDAHSPNGSFSHMDVRDDGNHAKPHKYNYHPSYGYGQYKENWWDGNSYHEIGSISDAIRTNGNFVASGNITAYGTYSDRRLKENIRPFTSARELIKGIDVYQFNYIGKDDDLIGVIAQEVEETLPQLVYELIDTDSDELRKAVRYDHLSAVLLKAVKEQDEEIQELKALVKTLMEKLQ